MNTELLLKVKSAILAHPETYRQAFFCGTAHCIGAHAVAIADPAFWNKPSARDFGIGVGGRAVELLDLDNRQTDRLLAFASEWPERFHQAYYLATTDRIRAQVAAKRIDHFIATDGAE